MIRNVGLYTALFLLTLGSWWLLDQQKEQEVVAVQLEEHAADYFSEGFVRVKKDGKWGFIDNNGKVVIEPQFRNVSAFGEGLAWFEGVER